MAIYTRYREKLINTSLRIAEGGIDDDDTVKVWGTIEGETTERQYWYSDLRGDNEHEVRDVIQANSKKREGGRSICECD